jgi:hypothetical protein
MYDNGTYRNPVNNYSDAKLLMSKLNIKTG